MNFISFPFLSNIMEVPWIYGTIRYSIGLVQATIYSILICNYFFLVKAPLTILVFVIAGKNILIGHIFITTKEPNLMLRCVGILYVPLMIASIIVMLSGYDSPFTSIIWLEWFSDILLWYYLTITDNEQETELEDYHPLLQDVYRTP